jgi:hypothetical protein
MTVLLVLATFLVFIVLDHLLNRHKALSTVSVEVHERAVPPSSAEHVDGFLVPGMFDITPTQLAGP